MPTPIEHLVIAERILASCVLTQGKGLLLERNETVRGAFFFGHIAPDVQVVSRQPRDATHFFSIPPTNRRPAYERMLTAYPRLAQPSTLSVAQAAFIVGYLSHLLLDECWVREVFYPVFGPEQTWGDRRERFLLHNVLRAWLDRRDLPNLHGGMDDLLRHARPDGWLPFTADADLCRWRDLVADQLEPGATIRTVEIFANRARVPDTEFLALLDPRVVEERILNRISVVELDRFHERAVARTYDLTVRYLSGCAEGESV